MDRRTGAGLVALFCLCLTSTAFAGGYEIGTDNGAESLGRAGASTANPSLTALYTNVAGVADVDYVDLYLANNFNFRHIMFQRAATEEGRQWDPIEDDGLMDIGPMLALHFRLNDWLSLAIGANGPASIVGGDFPAGTVEYDADTNNNLSGASRFDMAHSEVLLLWPSLAAGIRIPGLRNLRIGVSFQPAFAFLSFTSYSLTSFPSVLGEARVDMHISDPFIPGGQIGFLYRVNGFERLELGLQFRFSDKIRAEGEATPYLNARSENEAERPVSTATFDAPFPPMVMRFGVRYAHPRLGAPDNAAYNFERELFDVELDVVYEMNSAVDAYDITIRDVSLDESLTIDAVNIRLDHQWKDTVSLRLGGSVNLLGGHLTIMAGLSWESSTVPEEYTRLDYLGWMRIGGAVGIIGRFWLMEIALTYQYIHMPDRNVAVGTGQVFAPKATANDEDVITDEVINEGDYEAGYHIVGFSIGFRFDRPGGSRASSDDEEPIEETATVEDEIEDAEQVEDSDIEEIDSDSPEADGMDETGPIEELDVDDLEAGGTEDQPVEEMPLDAI